MTIDQGCPHREVLGHAHQRVVDGGVPVGVIFAQHLAHHTGAFAVRPLCSEAQLIHRIKDAAMHGLEAIASIRQRPAHDHAHRVLQVGARHLVAQVGLDDPLAGVARSGGIRHSACCAKPCEAPTLLMYAASAWALRPAPPISCLSGSG